MLVYAKLYRKGDSEYIALQSWDRDGLIVLSLRMNLIHWHQDDLRTLTAHNGRYGRSLLVTDGMNVRQYDRFVRDLHNSFFQQVLSIPQMFYDFDQQALPTMMDCCRETGIDPLVYTDGVLSPQVLAGNIMNEMHCKHLNIDEYLHLMKDLTVWAHEHCVEQPEVETAAAA
jgi:hypothetical protein